MVELQYVKKRKRRKIAAITTAVATVGISVFIIISFLGSRVGVFTVNLKTTNVKVSLATTSHAAEGTAYLHVGNIEQLTTYCYQHYLSDVPYKLIDDENSKYTDFANTDSQDHIISVKFFKYTFFVRNEGDGAVGYTMKINLLDNIVDPTTTKSLDEILRMQVIEDGVPGKVYAKKSYYEHFDPENPDVKNNLEYVCGKPYEPNYYGQAEPFTTDNLLASLDFHNLMGKTERKYTILYWLEGDDQECYGEPPKQSKLTLGVDIQAYED